VCVHIVFWRGGRAGIIKTAEIILAALPYLARFVPMANKNYQHARLVKHHAFFPLSFYHVPSLQSLRRRGKLQAPCPFLPTD
jgi:hypothetical protein